ncbi:MAG TPA: CARDB domain-containing protein [Desulfatiglandales bacterium]|nr:CARDB domain-containing protein [Desulfatiglandales bacterium]
MEDGTPKPIRYATVILYEDGLLRDTELARGNTDSNGYFSFTISMSGSKNVYVSVFCESSAARVGNSLGSTYWVKTDTKIINESDPSTWDLGWYIFGSGYANWQAMDDIIDEYQWINNRVDWTRSQVLVKWPTGNWPRTNGNVIYLPDKATAYWDRVTVLHEYGHCVMYAVYGNSFPSGSGPSPHYIYSESSPGFALLEGWAEFMQCTIDNNPQNLWSFYNGHGGNIEDNDWYNCIDTGDLDGDIIEGSVASSFWDIFDPVNDDDLYLGFDEIWHIIREYNPNDINSFLTYWFNHYNYSHQMRAIYYNYGIGSGGGDSWDPMDDSASNGTTLVPSLTVQSHGLHSLDSVYDDPDISDRFDWYKIHMTAEYTYYFYSTGNGDTYGELFDVPHIGNAVAEDDDNGGNGQFSFSYTPTVTQTYYLRVYAYEPWSGYINYHYTSPPPDLIISNIDTPSSASPGDNVTVYSSVRNQSDYPAKSFFLEFYLSTDNIITDDDKSLVSRHIDGLDAHETINHITNVEIPSSLSIGTYYIGAIADSTQAVKEAKEDNNTGYDSIDIIDAVAPLAPINLVCNPATWTNVNSFTIDWTNPDDTSGIIGAYYKLNSAPTHDTDGTYVVKPFSVSATMEGGQIIYVWLKDNSGNVDYDNRSSATIYYDGTAPTFPIISPSLSISKTGNLTITVNANEELKEPPTVFVQQYNHSGSTISVAGSDKKWTGSYVIIADHDGKATINVTGKDLAGNIGTGSGSFVADTTPPEAFISLFKPTPLKTGMADITLQIEDATGITGNPELKCTFSDNITIDIPLTSSGNTWEGSFFIESTTPDGTAEFSFSAVDAAGNVGTTITSGKTFEIDTAIEVAEGGTSSNSDGTKVEVPKNAVSEKINIRITVPDPNLSIIREADNNLVDDKGINPIKTTNLYRSIMAIGESDAEIKRFDKPIAISIPYPDGDQNGIVDKTNIREASLRMFYLDENQAKWLLVPDSQVDPDGNNVTARVSHFSIYTIMQLSLASNLSEVFGYPNPCYVKRDGYVRISNIPLDAKQVKIYIYNVAGELVRTLEEGDGIEELAGSKIGKWDGRNESDEMVASGIYVYLIKSRGTKKAEKIAIFW